METFLILNMYVFISIMIPVIIASCYLIIKNNKMKKILKIAWKTLQKWGTAAAWAMRQ